MAVDATTKAEYTEAVANEKKGISDLDSQISSLKKQLAKNKKLASLLRIGLVSKILQQINLRLKMNMESERILGIKNNSFLDAARKDIQKIFTELEAVITMRVDESINFNREMLDTIKPFNAKQRLNMYKHIKSAITKLKDSYGEQTKWKWSFPELWSKLAIVGKNIFDFREFQAKRDPRSENYYEIQEFLDIIKTDLFFAAGENANKFRLSTKSANDIMMGVRLLEDLRRISSVVGDDELLKKSKAGIDSYKATLKAEEGEKKGKKRQ